MAVAAAVQSADVSLTRFRTTANPRQKEYTNGAVFVFAANYITPYLQPSKTMVERAAACARAPRLHRGPLLVTQICW